MAAKETAMTTIERRHHQPEQFLRHAPTVPQSGFRSGMTLARLTTTRMPTQAITDAQARL